MKFSEKSSIFKIYTTKEFKEFKDLAIWPLEIKKNKLNHNFNFFKKFFPKNAPILVDAYNKTYEMIKDKRMKFHNLGGNAKYFSLYHSKDAKTILVLPGGGYEFVCFFIEGFPVGMYLYEKGYNVFICNYSTSNDAKYPSPMDDIAKIYKNIKNNYDINEYGLVGFSAGAHLAGSMGLKEIGFRHYKLDNPSFIMLSYPVITMNEYTHGGTRYWLLGSNPSKSLIKKYSIDQNVDPLYPKTYIWTCEFDEGVNSINTLLMKEALEKNKIPHKMELFNSTIHGLGLGSGSVADGWIDRALEFWEKNKK